MDNYDKRHRDPHFQRRALTHNTTAVGGGYFYCERHRKRFQFHKGCPDCQARKPSL